MSIAFSVEQWEATKAVYNAWWEGTLERPLIPVVLCDRQPDRSEPEAPVLSQRTCAELSIPAERLIDRLDYELSRRTYLGDAFPFIGMECFGPGVLSAFLGARLDNATGRVWFHAPDERPIADLHFQFDPDNMWFRRVCDIYTAGMARWQGQVLMGMTDVGGVMDVLSTFRPSETLLLDLYDSPDEVRRLSWEIHDAWHQCYAALNEVLQPVNPGYSDWGGIYSSNSCYMLQSDFSYMIGPEMFETFVRPELAASCEKIDHAFYHLDGVGQLQHLDSLLRIEALRGVQWVPGDGNPDCAHWPDVYSRIGASGKRIQLYGDFDVLDTVIAQVGSGQGIHLKDARGTDEWTLRKKLETYGIVSSVSR